MKTAPDGLRSSHWSTVLVVALSLSIGWGIRGNFGHEFGAMIPGALAALAVCLLSGRADWRARAPYFACFGALGWAFGGSISYMQVIAYTHSGHAPTQLYGFFCLFVIGFLWAGLGGAGTALPAVLDRERLTRLFVPMCWVLGGFVLLYCAQEPLVEKWEASYSKTEFRHLSPLYWFDADWIPAMAALLSMFCFDLWDRRFARAGWLPVCAAGGAALGYLVQRLCEVTGLVAPLAQFFVQRQGDVAYLAAQEGITREQAAQNLVINWPQVFLDIPQHVGWIAGLIVGVCLYFRVFGKFRSGASLFTHMAGGWLLGLLCGPTLLGFGGAGLRMTPPRGDDWAGIFGLFIGTLIWLRRERLMPVMYASLVSAIIGGLGFSGAAWLKMMLVAPGNPLLTQDADVIQSWAFWQSANWHSFLEQSYGFINGIGIAVAMALLARRVGRLEDDPGVRRWTVVFAASVTLFVVPFLNIFKNVAVWLEHKTVPETMRAPLFERIELSATAWFLLVYGLIAGAGIFLLIRHLRRPIAMAPQTWLGKGQLMYLAFLWTMVIANFERALPGFAEQRLLTEGVIFVNAVIVSVLILILPGPVVAVPSIDPPVLGRWVRNVLLAGLAAVLLVVLGMTGTARAVYGGAHAGHSTQHIRFGPEAGWITQPLRRDTAHK